MRRIPTAPVISGSLIVGFAVAAGTGSRPLGGVVLCSGGLWCLREWYTRRDGRTAAILTGVAFSAFVLSHVLALAIGAWPSVLLVSAITGAVTWVRADAPEHTVGGLGERA
jgi:hypothetical protein